MNKPKHLGTIVLWIVVVGIIVVIGLFLGLRVGKNTTYTPDSAVQQEQENNGYAVEQDVEPIWEIPEPIIEQKPVIPEPPLDGTRLDAKNYLDSLESIELGTGNIDKLSNTLKKFSGYYQTTKKDRSYAQLDAIHIRTYNKSSKRFHLSIDFKTTLPYKVSRALDDYYQYDWESVNTLQKKLDKLHSDFGFTHLKTSEMDTYFQASWIENGERVYHNTPILTMNDFYIPWKKGGSLINLSNFLWKESIVIEPSIVSVVIKSYAGDYNENPYGTHLRVDNLYNVKIGARDRGTSLYKAITVIDLTQLENPDTNLYQFQVEWKSDNGMNLNLVKIEPS